MMHPTAYSLPQRVLHWLMALLIFFNLIFSDGMEHWARLMRHGQPVTPDDVGSANIHAYVGIAILVLALCRLALRLVQGAPQPPADEPPILRLVAKATHGLLYFLFFAMPLSGIARYYFGVEAAGFLHGGPMKLALWALIAAHIAGALAHQFLWKSNVLARMTRG
ncbi:cytochrome b [Xaviernesmea rhizosphaerae]|uniref:cytochrome b n=1 Tax=Xaviernesmea rhizosphaerae TaxID=1672749 RepID=UPI003CC98EC8